MGLLSSRGTEPQERLRGLPGDPDDTHSRYIEATVHGIQIGCLYLPNGNPAPGRKFDHKLRWFERFIAYATELLAHEIPVVLTGDYNVIPTEKDAYKPERWIGDALFFLKAAQPTSACLPKAGRMPCARFTRLNPSTPIGITSVTPLATMQVSALTICYSVHRLQVA